MTTSARQRLAAIDRWAQGPILWLSVIWMIILVTELVHGFTTGLFEIGTSIWIVFLIQFLIKFWLASNRLQFLKQNWLFGLALLIPILRLFRIQNEMPWVSYLIASSGAQLVLVFGAINLEMRSLRMQLQKRGVPFAMLLTLIVVFVGSAALYHFENPMAGPGLHSYTEALWWSAMQMTTIGSSYGPVTPEGQAICLGISIYACGVFGYLTATLATFFIGQDASDPDSSVANQKTLNDLVEEIRALRQEIENLKSDQNNDRH